MRSAKADATARKAPRIGYPVPMQPRPQLLLNSDEIELWPAWLLRARANADARALAHGCWLLRRKRDGRYLATLDRAGGVRALVPGLMREPGLAAALRWRQRRAFRDARAGAPPVALPMHALAARLAALGLDAQAYAACSGLAPVPEPEWLAFAGFDRYRRPLWLHTQAARAWNGLQAAACADGIALDAISGYRSHAYQLGIFARKRARGLAVDEILQVNAAPGFSEHHSGRVLDIGTPGAPPAEESFETTAAFGWLTRHGGEHGFVMSYPRGNPHGIVYEPWHWRHDPPAAAGAQTKKPA